MTVIYTVQVEVTEEQVQEVIKVLNEYEIEEDEEDFLTLEEVKSKPDLLNYLCTEAVEGEGLWDPLECWNSDGWCDFRDYR